MEDLNINLFNKVYDNINDIKTNNLNTDEIMKNKFSNLHILIKKQSITYDLD